MKVRDSFAKVLLAVALLPVILSCEKGPNKRMLFGSKICVSIVTAETKSDRVAAPGTFVSERVVASVDGFDLIETVYENDIQPTATVTKGAVVTSDVLNSFQLAAYATDEWYDNALPSSQPGSAASPKPAGLYFGGTDGVTVSKAGTAWNLASDHYWLNGIPISFWCWNGVKPTVTDDGSYNYNSAHLADFQVEDVVTSQIDPIFAYNREVRNFDAKGSILDGKDAGIYIHFYHALAAVNFDISEIAADKTVDNIKLSNIYSKGSCDISVSTEGVPQFSWTPDSDSAKEFSQAFESSDFNADGRQPLSNKKVFLMVPQELRDDATITVTFSGAESSPKTIHLQDAYIWEAGKYYTYKLQRTGEISLELVGPTMPVDAHFGNAILKFGKKAPTGYSGDATWLRFAAPTSSTEYAAYPGASYTVDFAGLISEMYGTGDKTHCIEKNGYYYAQAFIDEYYLADESLSSFVNASDRSATLTISNSATGTSKSVILSQKSMQSPYDLTTASNPFGVEVIEDNTVTAGSDATTWCLSRNRDEDGNGVIEGSEIKWRTPSLQEYWNIWYGTHSMSAESWLGLETSQARTQYLSSDGFAYNGQASATIPSPSGTGTVRCIRDLGSGSNSMYSFSEIAGDINAGEAEKKYVLTMNGVSSESLREPITTKNTELTAGAINPGNREDAAHNKLSSKIQVASQYLTWPTGGTVTVPELKYYLAVVRTVDEPNYYFHLTENSSGNITQIDGRVKMLNPDPRLVYESQFEALNGATMPDSYWSYLDNNGVLHFHSEYTGWSANNCAVRWKINAAVKKADGTTVDLSGGQTCSLYFIVESQANLSGAWGTNHTVRKVNVDYIGNEPTKFGSGRYCRLGIQDGGPYTETDVHFPERSEEYDGSTSKDEKKSIDYLCSQYYYEDGRTQNGMEMKADLGSWRAPSQRELSIMLANRDNLKLTRATESGTGTYVWSEEPWPATDKVFSLRIKCSVGPAAYYNSDGYLVFGNNAPYKIRCVRDID